MPNTYKWPWIFIYFYILLISGLYIAWFHDHDFSQAPSDWGTMGDYFGGLINPLSSLMALYFLIKTYRAQKEELNETKKALQSSAIHQEAAAISQAELVKLEARRLASAEKLLTTQIISADITSKYDAIKFLSSEVNRCTTAANNKWSMPSIDGELLYSDKEIKNYRSSCLNKINLELIKISKLQEKLQKHHTSDEETF